MGILDWIGPTSLSKRRGWDALPTIGEQKASPLSPLPHTLPFVDPLTRTTFTPTSLASTVGQAPKNDGNSAVFACLQALASSVAEPELRVYRMQDGEKLSLDATPLGALLARPNPHFTMDALLAYVSTSLHVAGNAYWRKLRASAGTVVELWPISATRMEPVTRDGSDDFISFYRYRVASGRTEDIPAEDVVQFRYGVSDDDHRLGSAPLARLVAEVSSDQQATYYADRLLSNLAINGLALSFDKEAAPIDQATADELKARIQSAYGGANVGSAAVLSPGAKLEALGFSPEQMDMKTLHRVPEERISAVLGVPAIVAGLGAGLDRSTYANVREAREMFTEAKLIPLWRAIAATVTMALVPDFTSDRAILVEFDTGEVRALGEDRVAMAGRLKTLVEAGIITKDEARAEIGMDPLPEQEEQPAAGAARPTIVELPAEAASRRVTRSARRRKAIEDIPDRYADLREASFPTWRDELAAFLEAQQRRVNARLRAGADQAAELVTDGEAVLLGSTLEPLQRAQLGAVSRIVATELGIAFDLDDPLTRQFLEDCGVNIVGITETTRDAVRAALVEGQAAGEGIEVLARRIAGLPAFGRTRAETVSRTELGHAQNSAALASYRASSVVVGIRVHDGDYDAECRAMDGRTFTLDDAPATLQHPRCLRAFAPLVDVADLTRSA